MPLTLQTTTILAKFVGNKQRWSWYPAGIKICQLAGNSSRQLDQFEACATRKIALRYSVSRSERPLRPVPATTPRSLQGSDDIAVSIMETLPDDMACISPRHKHWPAGPAHFSNRRASTFHLSMARTGHLDICRASRFQIQ